MKDYKTNNKDILQNTVFFLCRYLYYLNSSNTRVCKKREMFTLIDLQLADPGEDDAIGSTTTKTKLYYYEQAVSYLKITSLPFSDQRFLKAFSTADFSKEWSSTGSPDSIRKKVLFLTFIIIKRICWTGFFERIFGIIIISDGILVIIQEWISVHWAYTSPFICNVSITLRELLFQLQFEVLFTFLYSI